MPEINIKETRFIPEKPNVIKNEQIEIYIPTGGYHKPGVVSFDSTGFIIDQFGHVKLRRNSVRNISNFEIDYETGVLTVYYDDDTVSKVNIPTDTNKLYSRNNLSTTIDIEPGSFVLDVNTGHWFVPISNRMTGFKDDKFIASLEVKGTERENEGYYTVPDTIFKGTDGSLLISVDTEDEKNNFHGRLLLFGGSIFTDNQVISITQDVSKRLFTIHKSDGTREYIQAVSEEYVKDYVNQKTASVYVAKGNVEFSKLPSIEELATGDYLGYVYNVTDSFVADIRFDAASYGKSFSAGTNVVVARNDDGTYQFDVLGTMGGMMDLSDYISNKGGTIHGGLVFDGVSETIYSSIDANEFKLANANKELSVNLSNITLYDAGTSTYIHVDYPTQSGRLIVDTDYASTDGSVAGLLAVNKSKGIGRANMSPTLEIIPADKTDILKKSSLKPIVPRNLDYAVKVGITTNTETLTDEEKASACEWLGAVKKVTTPTTYEQAYVKSSDGTKTKLIDIDYSNTATYQYIIRRDSAGAIYIPDASIGRSDYNFAAGQEAINKKYVDDNFLAKKTGLTGEVIITQKQDGTTSTLKFSNVRDGNAIVRYTADGRIDTGTPTSDYHAANKKYVDDGFVAKITSTTGYSQAYIKGAGGDQVMLNIAATALANSLVQRTNTGQVVVASTPISTNDATSKQYVDDLVHTKATKLYKHTLTTTDIQNPMELVIISYNNTVITQETLIDHFNEYALKSILPGRSKTSGSIVYFLQKLPKSSELTTYCHTSNPEGVSYTFDISTLTDTVTAI